MVLVDTSIWVDHLRAKDETLVRLLEQGQVGIHPMIIGELACGHLRHREALLGLWQCLPQVLEASHDEVLHYLHSQQLMGKGIGWVDLHLLTSVRLTPNAWLWTRDKRLQMVAESLGCHYLLPSQL